MRRYKLLLVLSVLGVSALLFSSVASAEIYNVTTGTVLYWDNFETVSPVATGDVGIAGDFDPGKRTSGQVGDGNIVYEVDSNMLQVTNHGPGTSKEPSPWQGSKMLRVATTGGTVYQTLRLTGAQTTAGDHIRWTQKIYLWSQSGSTGTLGIDFLGIDKQPNLSLRASHTLGGSNVKTLQYRVNDIWSLAGTGYARSNWETWTLDYVIGATTFDLKIGSSVQLTGLPIRFPGDGDLSVEYISFWTSANSGRLFMDELGSSPTIVSEMVGVPEPSSIVLLVLGMVGLLAYARRNRRTVKLLLVLSVLGVSTLLFSSVASAEIVNQTTGDWLFWDNYESLSPVNTTAFSGGSGDFDPEGETLVYEIDSHFAQVTSFGTPGAFEGDNYLRVKSTNENVYQTLFLSEGQDTVGDHIRYAQMVYIDSTGNATVHFKIMGTDLANNLISVQNQHLGSDVQNRVGWTFSDTGLSYTQDTWELWEFDYTIGDATFDLTVAGNQVIGLSIQWPALVNKTFAVVNIHTSANTGTVYFDEYRAYGIPEPSSIALLFSGMVGLLAYAWRKRK